MHRRYPLIDGEHFFNPLARLVLIIFYLNRTFQRLDGRKKDEYRHINIEFGLDWGNCLVTLGSTRVFAQVSCEIYQPNNSRPNEGVLQISAELAGGDAKLTDLTKINQVLERFYKDSKCIDLESLCIIAEEKVCNIYFHYFFINCFKS